LNFLGGREDFALMIPCFEKFETILIDSSMSFFPSLSDFPNGRFAS
jgi:hypothetical protein